MRNATRFLPGLKARLLYSSIPLAVVLLVGTSLDAQAGETEWAEHLQAGSEAYRELRYGDAERSFKAAIAEARKFGSKDVRLATSLTNLGVLYNFRGQFDKAEPLFEQAVTMKQKTLGAFHGDVVDSAARLCHFYLKRKKYAKADPLVTRIIKYGDMKVKELGNIRTSFATLEKYYKDHPELADSAKLVKQAESKTRATSNNDYLELAVLFDRVSNEYKSRSKGPRHPKCEQLYKLSLTFREKVLKGNHIALAKSYENLGKLYLLEKRYALACPLLKKAYTTCKSTLGFAKPQTYAMLHSWSRGLVGLGRYSQAERQYKSALVAFMEAYGKRSGHVANIEKSLSRLLVMRGRYNEAARYLKDAIKIEERLKGPHHASLAGLLDDYAELLRKADRIKEANKLHARARKIRG